MLYNIEKKKIKTEIDCLECPYFDKELKKCNGYNEVCFEYDNLTNSIIDGKTKMKISLGGK